MASKTRKPICGLVLACLLSAPSIAEAQSYPSSPVRIVVPFAPGGTADIVARLIAVKLRDRYSQSFFVENKSGANGLLGTDVVARAAPDGYTWLLATVFFAAAR